MVVMWRAIDLSEQGFRIVESRTYTPKLLRQIPEPRFRRAILIAVIRLGFN
jgi:hypothetical protein